MKMWLSISPNVFVTDSQSSNFANYELYRIIDLCQNNVTHALYTSDEY